MNPEICTVVVGGLASTGADAALGLVIATLLLLVLGIVTQLLVRRERALRRTSAVLAVLATLSLGSLSLGALVLHDSTPAHAAPEVSYNGCTLFALDESDIVFEAVATSSLLPGDSATAITAVVENRFAGTIELSGQALLGTGALAPELTTEVLFDGAVGPVVLAPGDRVTVTVVVSLALGVSNALQNETTSTDLVLTAIER